jgi:hypothetical protein
MTTTNPFDALGELIDHCHAQASALRETHEGETVDDLYGLMKSIADDLDAYGLESREALRDAIANEKDIAADYAEERDQAVDRTSHLAQDILDYEHGLLDYHELLQAARENL